MLEIIREAFDSGWSPKALGIRIGDRLLRSIRFDGGTRATNAYDQLSRARRRVFGGGRRRKRGGS
jgi:hypothetical protein